MSARTADPGGLREAAWSSLHRTADQSHWDAHEAINATFAALRALTPEATAPDPEEMKRLLQAAHDEGVNWAQHRTRTADPGGLDLDALPDYNPYPNPFDENGDFLDSAEYAARTADPGGLRALAANRQVPDANVISGITVGELRAAITPEATAPDTREDGS